MNKKLVKNKIFALAFLALGIGSVFIDGDATFLIFAIMLSAALFFSKENWIC